MPHIMPSQLILCSLVILLLFNHPMSKIKYIKISCLLTMKLKLCLKKRKKYWNLKFEGIIESPINICITSDRERTGKAVIGRTHMKEMDLYSSVCAVQNFWLAARAEGIRVGWVSILHHEALKNTLSLPDNVVPIAYLCVGYVSHFNEKPELETENWLPRRAIDELISFNTWGSTASSDEENSLINQLKIDKNLPSHS